MNYNFQTEVPARLELNIPFCYHGATSSEGPPQITLSPVFTCSF